MLIFLFVSFLRGEEIVGCSNFVDVSSIKSFEEYKIQENENLCFKGNFLCFGENIQLTASFFYDGQYNLHSPVSESIGIIGQNVYFDNELKLPLSKLFSSKNQTILLVPVTPSNKTSFETSSGTVSLYDNSYICTKKECLTSIQQTNQYVSNTIINDSITFVNTNPQHFEYYLYNTTRINIISEGEKKTVNAPNDKIGDAKLLKMEFLKTTEETYKFLCEINASSETLDSRIPEFYARLGTNNQVLTLETINVPLVLNLDPEHISMLMFVVICAIVVVSVVFIMWVIGKYLHIGKKEPDAFTAIVDMDEEEEHNADDGNLEVMPIPIKS